MKTILCSFFAAIAMASCSMAQSITVTLTPTSAPLCAFQASGVVQGITMPDPTPGASPSSPGVLQPITITKGPEQCSNQLMVDIFRPVPTVTIVLASPVTTLRYTLTNVTVTDISDQSQPGTTSTLPSGETVTLNYNTIKVEDFFNNTTFTCSKLTNTCS
jgi:hypothetical protein